MTKEIFLNDQVIQVDHFEEAEVNGLKQVTLDFKVTHDDYHNVTTLLYKGTFNIRIPSKNNEFKGTIHNYSTSITNLYEKGQTGDFHLVILEVKE
ncbi:DUF3219 family protein [Neobacillus terrae]|uniref:DUF3219 family protein n=1 Tax=Neobacillus terrae TaxID=3034837 RepID=UPI00140E2574|nr:DUF3219 family protein [Neobacillus terrae]NHM32541.1 DUF3219 family protein [Neobacillus terrae]